MRITHVLDKSTLLTMEQDGYNITTLPPFRKFRGLDIPWERADLLADESEEVAKSSRSRKVVHLAAGQYGLPVEVHVKRYNFKSILKMVLRAGRKSRAREEFDLGWKLLAKKIRTPRPVWLAEAKGAVAKYSIVATESIPEAESALDRWRRCANERQRHELCTAMGQFTAMLHDVGFYHDDYKSAHLLILPNRPSSADEFSVIDLLGGAFPTMLTTTRRARMLFQLVRSFIPKKHTIGFRAEHRHTILKAYCGSEGEAQKWEKWVNRVAGLKGLRL